MKQCLGCGAVLQNENKDAIGYVQNAQMDYCQRCFKMIHYDQHGDVDYIPDNAEIMKQLSALKGNYIWIMDIMDLDSSLHCVFADFFKEHECVIILNKCDLLPRNTAFDKLADYVLKRIKNASIRARLILTRGVNPDFCEQFDANINIAEPQIMCGLSNVGKSTIINHLLKQNRTTVNRYPATTININEINTEKYHFYDTVGIVYEKSVQPYLDNDRLKKVMIARQIKPQLFQIYQPQSFAIGGLVRLDIQTERRATLIFHNSDQLNIHRGKIENAQNYWDRHYGEELQPVIGENGRDMKHLHFIHRGKCEYFICGLGFVQIHCSEAQIDFYINHNIEIFKRECML